MSCSYASVRDAMLPRPADFISRSSAPIEAGCGLAPSGEAAGQAMVNFWVRSILLPVGFDTLSMDRIKERASGIQLSIGVPMRPAVLAMESFRHAGCARAGLAGCRRLPLRRSLGSEIGEGRLRTRT